jgi:hypothetical protein
MYPSINIPAINIPAVTGKIYVIIENLTDIIEELNKDPSSAQVCVLEGIAGLDGDGDRGDIDDKADIGDSGAGGSKADIGGTEGGRCGSAGEGRGGGSSGAGSGGSAERGGGEEAASGGEEKRGLIDSPGKRPEITESPESKDFDLFRYLSGNEGLELIRLESTRQSLLRAQGFLEEKKQVFIKLARSRQVSNR